MDQPPKFSYRSLELLCRKQAAICATLDTRIELERMALEYKRLADRMERQWPMRNDPHESTALESSARRRKR